MESKQYARIIDLISEGPIVGLKKGHRSIYLNDTPLATPGRSSSYSRSGTTITVRLDSNGFSVGQSVYIEFISGKALSGTYVVTSEGTNSFTVESTESGSTSGTAFSSATYSQSERVLTVTSNGHGLSADDPVYLEFVSGNGDTGKYSVTSATTDTFSVKADQSMTTSGRVLWSSYNFQDTTIYQRLGSSTQNIIPFDNSVEVEKSVGVTVTQAVPVIRAITDTNVDAVRVTITFPQLQRIQGDGDIDGGTVKINIDVQYNGAGFDTVISDTVAGKSSQEYQRDYIVQLSGKKPAEIRVVRDWPDPDEIGKQTIFSWSSYTEITLGRFSYPNSALVGLRIDAEQFSSIPERKYLIRGLKIGIPSNATVDQTNGRLIYSGIWDGTFDSTDQWCSDPAWVLWDLLTSKRYGFGDFLESSKLDKWAFYSASQYCSGLVSDGFGGVEPRFSCNVNLQTAEEAYKTINDMCSIFRAMPYWSTGSLTVAQDKPADSSYLFTLANVSEAGFSYQSSSQRVRPTVAVVSYLDLSTRDIAYEAVEDTDAIARYGIVTRDISAFACTSRGQANRIGKWLLYSEQYENEIVSFTASIDAGVIVRPGQIIEIADPVRAGQRRGGRISSATKSQIEIDSASGISTGGDMKLSVILPDGTVETRDVSSISGTTITVSPQFSQKPNSNSIWIYQTTGIQTSTWRVLSISEKDKSQYDISAIAYNASKYDYIESGESLQERDVTNLDILPKAPTDIDLVETLYYYQDDVRAKVTASWKSIKGVNQYQVHWRKNSSNWTIINVTGTSYEILNITPGTFAFKIYSLSASLKLSPTFLSGTIEALGKTAPPSDVEGLNYVIDSLTGALLSWSAVPDIDVSQYEIRVGSNWNSSELVGRTTGTTYKFNRPSSANQTFLVKAIDTSRIYSNNAASITTDTLRPNTVTVQATLNDPSLSLTWQEPDITSYEISYYRVSVGNAFAASTELARVSATSFSVVADWLGTRTFWVMPYDIVGNSAASPGSVSFQIVKSDSPLIFIEFSGSNANITWNAVRGTLATRTYIVKRSATTVTDFDEAETIANVSATNYLLAANWSGLQRFWVAAVDANGTIGDPGFADFTIFGPPGPIISSSFSGRNVVIRWSAVKGTLSTDYYEIRRGYTFSTASVVARVSGTTYTLRADWGGSQRFWIVAVNVNGTFGTEENIDIVVVPPRASTLSKEVIDNNVLLRWNDVTETLPIEYYTLRKGSDWETAEVIGQKQGSFTTVFESKSGLYKYWIAGVDSAGNVGTPASVDATVNQPPDYMLQLDANSTWTGASANIYPDPVVGQVVNVNTTETWQSHFTNLGYNSPQDQITAGYSYYLMPTQTTAYYEEEIDYGSVLPGTKILSTLTSVNITGSTTITPTIRIRGTASTAGTYSQAGTTTITITSNSHGLVANDYVWLDFTSGTAVDGTYIVVSAATNTFTVTAAASATTSGNVSWVKWTTYSGVNEVYGSSFRYFRVRYDFASAGGNDLLALKSLNTRLDSKLKADSGMGTANASDSGGTSVNFATTFIDVNSIIVTPSSTTGVIAVYDFVDVPNPTGFKVLLFNTSGTRVSGAFSWSARGV